MAESEYYLKESHSQPDTVTISRECLVVLLDGSNSTLIDLEKFICSDDKQLIAHCDKLRNSIREGKQALQETGE